MSFCHISNVCSYGYAFLEFHKQTSLRGVILAGVVAIRHGVAFASLDHNMNGHIVVRSNPSSHKFGDTLCPTDLSILDLSMRVIFRGQ